MQKLVVMLILGILCLPHTLINAQDDPSSPTPIRYGETLDGAITPEIPSVGYSFEGAVGDIIQIKVTGVDTALDPYVTLSSQTGTLLASDDNSAGGTTALLSVALPGTGLFVITVSHSPLAAAQGFGTFNIELTGQAVNPIQTEATTTGVGTTTIEATERFQNIPLNSTVEGSFTQEGNFNVYWFEGEANHQISAQPDLTAEVSPLLILYRSNLTEIVRSGEGQPLNTTLSATDMYFLVASNLDPGTAGRYSFVLADNTPVEEQDFGEDVLVYGQTKNSAITNTTPTQRFRFSGEAGDIITITMSRIDGDLDGYLILADSSGNTLAEDDNSGGIASNPQIKDFSLPTSGEYFVIASRLNEDLGVTTGAFSLTVESDAPPRIPDENSGDLPTDYVGLPQIVYGETVNGTVNNDNFLNIWVFFGNEGDAVTISMEAATTDLDPYLILLDAERIPLTEDDDIIDGQDRDALIEEFALPRTGYYAIVATRFDQGSGTSSGDYSLSINTGGVVVVDTDTPLTERLQATPLTSGETPNANFNPLVMGAFYSFAVAEGTSIDFAVTTDDNSPATVMLLDSGLRPVAVEDDGILLAIDAPKDDDYLVLVAPAVGPAFNVEGGFFVTLNIDVGGGSGSDFTGVPLPIAYGNVVDGEITETEAEQRYTFVGSAGDSVEIIMSANGTPTVDAYLQILDASGAILKENDDIDPGVVRDARIVTTLPADGTYTIVASRYQGEDAAPTFGDYTLTLRAQDPTVVGVEQAATNIVYNQPYAAEIDEVTYLHFFYFVGTQGDTIQIRVNTTSGNLDAILYLYAFTSNNEPFLLIANDDSDLGGTYDPYIEYTLPRSGPYLIGVTRYNGDDIDPTVGTFTVTVTLADTPEAPTEAITE